MAGGPHTSDPRRVRRQRAVVCGGLLVASFLVSGIVRAYDPSHVWRTLHTPNLEIHYPVGTYELAVELGNSAEAALEELTLRLAWVPERPINLVLNDDTDAANGFAQSLPYNLIGLNAVAPEEVSELSDYRDWTYDLVSHELAHIVHLDTIIGVPRYVNAIFGRLLAPNAAQPRWFIEGLAVYFESALGSGGRAKSPFFDMFLRAAVLDGTLMDLGEVSGAPLRWPRGTTSYLYGGRFLDFLARTYGEEVLQELSYAYGRRLIPFAVNRTLKDVVATDYPTAYDDFVHELEAKVELQVAEVMRLGRHEGTPLTEHGQELSAARVSPEGAIYFVESPLNDHASLKVLRPNEREREIGWVHSGAIPALLPGGRTALLAQIEIEGYYRFYGDLFQIDLESGATRQLTHGARAQSVDVSTDGELVVFVQTDGAHSVVRAAPREDLTKVRTVVDLGPETQVWSPRLSPDGQLVVFVGFANGQRDIYLADVASGNLRPLSNDLATDGGPVFWPDGHWVLFHSDRDGIYNLYAVPVAGGEPRRLSRVLTGAFNPEPVPGKDAVIYQSYGSDGFDLARLDDVDPSAAPLAEPARERAPTRGHARLMAYPSSSYNPVPTLLPKVWSPVLETDAEGNTYGVSVNGSDAVGLHTYQLQAWWGSASDFVGFTAAYANHQFHPGVAVGVSRTLGYAAVPYIRNGRANAVEEELWTARAATTWPLISRRDWALYFSTSYELLYRQNTRPLTFDPFDLAPQFPDQGRFGATRLSVGFSNVRAYGDSISAEDGVRVDLALRVEDPYLGSQYSAVSGTLGVTGYLENPLIERQVLAVDLTLGWGKSSYRQRSLFSIGGAPARDIILDIFNGFWGGSESLRGFPAQPFVGDAEAVGHVEYRLPLVDIQSGVATVPIYLRTLSAALFVDGAALAESPGDLVAARHISAGVELALGLFLAYAFPIDVKLGYGHGLGPDHVQALYLVTGNAF